METSSKIIIGVCLFVVVVLAIVLPLVLLTQKDKLPTISPSPSPSPSPTPTPPSVVIESGTTPFSVRGTSFTQKFSYTQPFINTPTVDSLSVVNSTDFGTGGITVIGSGYNETKGTATFTFANYPLAVGNELIIDSFFDSVSIGKSTNGTMYVLAAGNNVMKIFYSTDFKGGVWNSVPDISAPNYAFSSRMYQSRTVIGALWASNTGLYGRRSSDGTTFDTVTNFISHPLSAFYNISLAVSPLNNGGLYICTCNTFEQQIWVSYSSDDGVTWAHNPLGITAGAVKNNQPVIFFTNDTDLIQVSSTNAQTIQLNHFNGDTNTWSDGGALPGAPVGVSPLFVSGCMVGNFPAVIYSDQSSKQMYFVKATSVDGSTWGTHVGLPPPFTQQTEHIFIGMSGGVPWVVIGNDDKNVYFTFNSQEDGQGTWSEWSGSIGTVNNALVQSSLGVSYDNPEGVAFVNVFSDFRYNFIPTHGTIDWFVTGQIA
jgi:hypothetical protein